jgi:hypothetical protein
LAGLVFHTRPVRRLLFRCSLSTADWTGESQYAADKENESRTTFHSDCRTCERDCSSFIPSRRFPRRRCQSCPFPSSLS